MPDGARRQARRGPRLRPRHRDPGVQRGSAICPAASAGCTTSWPPRCPTPRGSPWPTTPAPTAPWRWRGSWPRELPDVDVIHLDAKGRGGALHAAWMSSTATVVAYMDVDLSTDLTALMPLVAPLISGHSDVAIGSRLSASSRVVRGPEARIRLAQLQFDPPQACSVRASRMRSAGSRRSAPTWRSSCCRWSPTPVGSSTPNCWSSPNGPGCASTRCPSTGSTTPTRGSTCCTPRSRTSRAAGGSAGPWPPARCRCANCRPASAASRWCPAFPTAWSVSWCGSGSSAWQARWPTRCCTWCCIPRWVRRPPT